MKRFKSVMLIAAVVGTMVFVASPPAQSVPPSVAQAVVKSLAVVAQGQCCQSYKCLSVLGVWGWCWCTCGGEGSCSCPCKEKACGGCGGGTAGCGACCTSFGGEALAACDTGCQMAK